MQYPIQILILFSAVAYADTNDYYWPLLSTHLPALETALEKDETAYTNVDGKVDPLPETRGPFGFGDAIQLNDDKVSYNLRYQLSRTKFSARAESDPMSKYLSYVLLMIIIADMIHSTRNG